MTVALGGLVVLMGRGRDPTRITSRASRDVVLDQVRVPGQDTANRADVAGLRAPVRARTTAPRST